MPLQVWFYSALVALSVVILWWALKTEATVSDQAVRNLGSARPLTFEPSSSNNRRRSGSRCRFSSPSAGGPVGSHRPTGWSDTRRILERPDASDVGRRSRLWEQSS